jgi:hypothetical protein
MGRRSLRPLLRRSTGLFSHELIQNRQGNAAMRQVDESLARRKDGRGKGGGD